CRSARSATCCWPPPTNSARTMSSPTCSARRSTLSCPASTSSSSTPTTARATAGATAAACGRSPQRGATPWRWAIPIWSLMASWTGWWTTTTATTPTCTSTRRSNTTWPRPWAGASVSMWASSTTTGATSTVSTTTASLVMRSSAAPSRAPSACCSRATSEARALPRDNPAIRRDFSFSEVLVAVHVQHARLHRLGLADVGRQVMEIAPELGVAAADAPAHHNPVEGLRLARLLQGRDELRHLAGRQVEDEVRVAGQHPRIDRQRVQLRLVAQRLAEHESHVAVRTVAQQAVHLALAISALHAQQGRFRQVLDHPEPAGRASAQTAERLFGSRQV